MERILNWIFKVAIPPAFICLGSKLVDSIRNNDGEWKWWAVLIGMNTLCYWIHTEVK